MQIFRERRQTQIAARLAVAVGEVQRPQGGKAALLHLQIFARHPTGGVVVNDDILSVCGFVHIGLNAEIGTVARCHKRGGGVFPFDAA